MKQSNVKTTMLIVCGIFLCIACALGIYNMKALLGEDNKEDSSNTNKHKIALITKSTTSAFWKSVLSGANAASTEYNLTLMFEGPENEEDYNTQNEMIAQAVEDGAEAIVFSAVDYNANAKAIDEAAKQGVKIVGIDSDVNSEAVACRIATNNYTAGCMAGEAALACEDEVLNVGIVNFDKNSENGQQRERGFRETIEKDSRVKIVDTINVISTIADAKASTTEMLEEHPEINVIATFNEWTSLGVGYAIREQKLAEKTTVVAFDSNVISVGMLETGEVDALIVQNPYAMGYLGVEKAYQLIKGGTSKKENVDTESTLITRDNMFDDKSQRVLFTFQQDY